MLKQVELFISALLALLFLIGYAVYALLAETSGGHPVGHLLGLLGLILMLMTETLYTLRKRASWFRMGSLRYWLSFHIITGIVGPWLALLHAAFQFKGWAGLTMLLVVIVFISGFVGRYIYAAVPRTMAGTVTARKALNEELAHLQAEIIRWGNSGSEQMQSIIGQYRSDTAQQAAPVRRVLFRFFYVWRDKRRLHQAFKTLKNVDDHSIAQLKNLLRRRQELDRQIASLKAAQQLLRYWHRIHVPLGLMLFTSIAIHVGATLYFGALF